MEEGPSGFNGPVLQLNSFLFVTIEIIIYSDILPRRMLFNPIFRWWRREKPIRSPTTASFKIYRAVIIIIYTSRSALGAIHSRGYNFCSDLIRSICIWIETLSEVSRIIVYWYLWRRFSRPSSRFEDFSLSDCVMIRLWLRNELSANTWAFGLHLNKFLRNYLQRPFGRSDLWLVKVHHWSNPLWLYLLFSLLVWNFTTK